MGLLVVLATAAATLCVLYLVLESDRRTQEQEVLIHRQSIVRVLASSLGSDLVDPERRDITLQKIRYSETNPLFAYAAVSGANGTLFAKITGSGVSIPNQVVPDHPGDWSGVSRFDLPGSGREVTEMHAPLLQDGTLAGYLRMGYLTPSYAISLDKLSFLALLALPLFLLAGLFYFFLRRELGAIAQLEGTMRTCREVGNWDLLRQVHGGESGRLAEAMHALLDGLQQELDQAKTQAEDLEVSTKITDYRRARSETVLEALPDYIVVMDESGLATFASSKIRNLLGVTPEEVVGKPINEWCEDSDIRSFLMRHETHETVGHSSEEYKFSPAIAPEKTISIATFPLFSIRRENQLLGKLILFRDITTEHLAARSRADFVAHMSHELKTPLNVLSMYSESLLETGEDPEFRTEACNIIHDEVERLATLINNLLSITQFEMGSMRLDRQRVRLQDLLQDAFDNISRAGKGQDMQFDLNLPRELTPIFVDKDLLRIAINNLLTNAIKYNRPGGTVTLSAEETDDVIRIKVSDTGIGIAPENWQKIFEKFYRVEDDEVRARSGHGLGLPLAMQIVQMHHGQIHVDSVPGEGTEFIIEFNKQSGLLRRAAET